MRPTTPQAPPGGRGIRGPEARRGFQGRECRADAARPEALNDEGGQYRGVAHTFARPRVR